MQKIDKKLWPVFVRHFPWNNYIFQDDNVAIHRARIVWTSSSCNNVALPYFTFWYLLGRATIRRTSTVVQKYFEHYLVFPMISTLLKKTDNCINKQNIMVKSYFISVLMVKKFTEHIKITYTYMYKNTYISIVHTSAIRAYKCFSLTIWRSTWMGKITATQREWITPATAPLQRSDGVVAVSKKY